MAKDCERCDDWGELNTGKQAPVVCVFDVVAQRAVRLGGQREDVSYGQPHWAPDGRLLCVRRPPAYISCASSTARTVVHMCS